MSKKILVIEDEMQSLKSAFEIANFRKYGNELVIKNVPRSQDVQLESLKEEYALIFVDITLANNTEKNGYGVLQDIINGNYFPKNKLIVMTGNSQIAEGLKQNGLPKNLEILMKPFTFIQLEHTLAKHIRPMTRN
ncbi:MAG: hypothetical protein K2G67_00125 [Muribaculaceae bacterium]|nr:hypothetical protein [Muribaculaceae bacterium]